MTPIASKSPSTTIAWWPTLGCSCRRIASNRVLLNFGRTRSPGGSSHEIGDSLDTAVGITGRNASANPISASARRRLRLIDTRLGSLNCHYVNRSVRGSRPPAKWRISLARFDLPRLRMRRISHPQVVASPIRPTPGATHSVATMPYRPFSPSARLLIPDWAQPKRLLPTPFPQLSPTPIHSGGRGQL